ncbi:hypothetical protein [Georgenia sp. SUBG003]|uniref:hypothetical protein n=1 Tax=Georgenia sp. SUBG003 TaxID=1497974 RepID=UPI003AB4C4A5
MSAPPSVQSRTRLRAWSTLLAAVASVSLLAACTGEPTEPSPETPQPTAPSASATASPTPPPPRETDFPDETNTGVPAGTQLRPSDKLEITEDGTVIDGLEISGNVVVEADDVVIRNSRIILTTGKIAVRVNGDNFLMEDSEIDGQGRANPAIAYNGYTLRRVQIYNVAEGPRITGDDVTIEDSYIHGMVQDGDNHTDVVQVMSGSNIVIRGNNLQAYNPESGIYGNAAFMFGEDSGPVSDCLVEGNLMNGGNYTVNGGGSGTDGAACEFRDNAFQDDTRHGTSANLGPNVVWDESNVRLGTSTPVGG